MTVSKTIINKSVKKLKKLISLVDFDKFARDRINNESSITAYEEFNRAYSYMKELFSQEELSLELNTNYPILLEQIRVSLQVTLDYIERKKND